MYIPSVSSPAAGGVAPATAAPAPTPPPPVTDLSGSVRLTQLAVTGPGAALIANSVNPRPAAASERNPARSSQFLAQVLAQSSESETPAPAEAAAQLALDLDLPEASENAELARGAAAYTATQERNLSAIITSDGQAVL